MLDQIFRTELPQLLDGYIERSAQLALANSVQDVMDSRGCGLFEAGTGIGKTLAYLVPAFMAQGPVMISTGTRTLQDQLFFRDIPLLAPLFPQKRVALLKGRANYLCPYRLKQKLKLEQENTQLAGQLVEVRTWSSSTKSGDLNELLDPEEDQALIRHITSTRDSCLGSKCPEFHACPLYRARESAQDADIVVINHHLLFADLVNREDGIQSLLPTVETIILDEAHQAPDIARQFFGMRMGSGQLLELVRDARSELRLVGDDDAESILLVENLEKRVVMLRKAMLDSKEQAFADWLRGADRDLLYLLDQALEQLVQRLDQIAVRSEGLAQCAKRAEGFLDLFAMITEDAEDDRYVHWIERSTAGFTVHLSPLSVAEEMQGILARQNNAWIFTSATLSVSGDFSHFRDEFGLESPESDVFQSPFDYQSSVVTYLPESLPDPGTDEHTMSLVSEILPLISVNPGRTLFLFTSYRALEIAAQQLAGLDRPVFAQGTMSRSKLREQFIHSEKSVLLATQSFWEGIDLRGSEMRCLIIDKLPFPNPADPLMQARSNEIARRGLDAFSELYLPDTALSLRQGFGRLIRQEKDRGLFVLGDTRLQSRSYGGYLKSILPDMKWTRQKQDAVDWLENL